MLGDKISVRIVGETVFVKNISNSDIDNVFISIKSIFYLPLLREKFTLKASEEISFEWVSFKWKDRWGNGTIYVRVYENHNLIYSRDFFDKTKCYVLISNKAFEKLVEQLIVGLDRYSNVDILHYTINYKSDLTYDNLVNIEFTLTGDTQDPQYMQFTKPPVFIDVLNRGYKGVVFLDADIQVRSNIDSLFDYIHQIEDGPIMHKSQWDYIVANGNYVPQPKLHKFMQLEDEQPAPHGVTNVVIFNDTHLEMFKKWEEICFSDEIQQIRKEEFLHDELIFNCLMWRDRKIPKLFFFALNILTEKDVNFFYNFENTDYIDGVNLNDHGLGQYLQSYLPYDKTSIIGFHCVKDIEMAGKINDIILINEKIPKQVMTPKTIYSDLEKNIFIL
jgi:hypothetical protein